jgi:hypothetical protein
MKGGAVNFPKSPYPLSKIGLDFYVKKVWGLKSEV